MKDILIVIVILGYTPSLPRRNCLFEPDEPDPRTRHAFHNAQKTTEEATIERSDATRRVECRSAIHFLPLRLSPSWSVSLVVTAV